MMINENNWGILQDAIDITSTDYDIKWYDAENFKGYIEEDSILSLIEDLVGEVEHLKDENKKLQEKLLEPDGDEWDYQYECWRDSRL